MPSNKKLLQAAAGSAGGDNLFVEDVFSTFLYAGTGSSLAINNGLDLSGEGGLMWLKGRDGAYYHKWYDTERGIQYAIESNTTDANQTEAQGVTAVGSSGFTLGTDGNTNSSGAAMSSWSFRKAAGFCDIVTYTGNGQTSQTISHNLGSTPKMMIMKCTTHVTEWYVYHASLGANNFLQLHSTVYAQAYTGAFNNTAPTDTQFTVGNDSAINASGRTYVAYLFGDDAIFGEDGDEQICKMGTATLGGSGTGEVSINLGFEPQFVLLKTSAVSENWLLVDTMNGAPVFPSSQNYLSPNTSSANASYSFLNITSTGFNLANLGLNRTYIYMAIRRPMKVPEAGTEVYFQTTANAGTTLNTGFVPDFWIGGATAGNGGTGSQFVMDRLRGAKYLATSTAALEVGTNDPFNGFPTNTFMNNSQGGNRVEWIFRRASQFMDVIAYTGNGTAGATQAHNLTVVPEFIIWKNRTGTNDSWISYWSTLGVGNYLLGFNTTTASGTGSLVNSTAPTASVITLSGQGWNVNNNGSNYIAYLFATLAGISKVGSVVHSGTTNVDCGFSAGARFVLVRRTDASGGWYVWDTARGIVSGNDPYLLLNSSAAQVTNTDYIDPLASGFTLTSSFTAGTYIFLAIA